MLIFSPFLWIKVLLNNNFNNILTEHMGKTREKDVINIDKSAFLDILIMRW